MATVREVLAGAVSRLASAGVADAPLEAAWLLAHALGVPARELRAQPGRALAPDVLAAFERLVARRASREPIQYILGSAEFLGMELQVTPEVLIPRLDTEVLVRAVAERLTGRGPVRVADIGTGSGAIALGLARLLPESRVDAVDISPEALAVASVNAHTQGLTERITFLCGDLLSPLAAGPYHAIVSNPPYIPEEDWRHLAPDVRDWEPRQALTPGADGLHFYRRLALEAPERLVAGGWLAVEVGMGQAPAVEALLAGVGLAVATLPDSAGIDRVVVGQKS